LKDIFECAINVYYYKTILLILGDAPVTLGPGTRYCNGLPNNALNNLWILDFISRFIGYTPGGITVTYYSLNLIVSTLR
jgi:hypothetical protein